jgi:hypothetical protein
MQSPVGKNGQIKGLSEKVENIDQDLNWKILGTFNKKEDKHIGWNGVQVGRKVIVSGVT